MLAQRDLSTMSLKKEGMTNICIHKKMLHLKTNILLYFNFSHLRLNSGVDVEIIVM